MEPRAAFVAGALAVVIGVAAWPHPLSGQDASGLRPRLEVVAGWGGHGGGQCYHARDSDFALGAALQTRGPWLVRIGADVFLGRTSCVGTLLTRDYQGQEVEVRGDPATGPRLALDLGYGFSVLGLRPEVAAGVGLVLTHHDYGRDREDWSARPWYGAIATVRLPPGVGLQFETGRHQVAERYYAMASDVLVAELPRWELMWRISVTIPIQK
ncbi:MAG: hypothetical protein OEO79_11385 [Gemmatimonadota bacterium]|nr:hypothetical protein [Gemmatimonadota bacterium]